MKFTTWFHVPCLLLVSTYVVCERLLWCMSLLEWLKFWSKFYRIPLFSNTVSEYPPPKMKIVRDLGTLTFQFQNTLPPPKIEIWADLGTLTFQFQNTLPPPPENWNLGRSWHFDFSVSEYPPPPENWNLGRSWHFKTFQFQNYVWQVTTCGDFIQPG